MGPNERKVTLGHAIGISEQDAVGIFREITIEEIDAVLDPHFKDVDAMLESLTSEWKYEQMRLFYHLRQRNPAAYYLGKIIDTQFSEPDIRASQKERLARIMDKSGDEADDAIAGMHEVNFIFRGLMAGVAGAFTPRQDREVVFNEKTLAIRRLGLSAYQGEQITTGVADLSAIIGPRDVVQAVGTNLLIDRETAMDLAALEHGVSLDELKQLRSAHPKFTVVHTEAAQRLYDGTIIGAMLDHSNNGATNVFRPEPNPENRDWDFKRYQPQVTSRGVCTGSSFVMASMMAMGRVVRRNDHLISAVIQEHMSSRPIDQQ